MMQTNSLPSLLLTDREDFRYTSARVKVLESQLLTQSDFLRFRNLSPTDRIAIIQDTFSWFDGNPKAFTRQWTEHLYKVTKTMTQECNAPDLGYYFLLPRGIEQIQALLEGAKLHTTPVPMAESFCRSGDLSELPAELIEPVAEARRLYKLGLTGSGRRLLSKSMVNLLSGSRYSKLPYFKTALTRWVDTLDVRLLISATLRKGTYRGLPGGSLHLRSDSDIESVARDLGIHSTDLFEIERVLDERLFKTIIESRLIPAGPEVVFGYLWELEREFRNASMLIAGALVAIPPKELENAYRRTYAK